ncbi:MAG: endolytic transglycosylase MltG [Proteobacteria bacterium]|nr:endolytic transglycosylase MltG [Pseudomonadota bacterium]
MRKAISAVILLALIVCAFALIAGYYFYHFAHEPTDSQGHPILIMVHPGQGLNSTTNQLLKQNLISSLGKFKILAAVTGKDKNIKAGEYLFSSAMSPWDILQDLINGNVYLHKITIPEGYNLYQIGHAIQEAGICSETDFIAAATDPALARQFAIPEPAETFEGYLFPETYHFPKGVSPNVIIKTMVGRFRSVFKQAWYERATALGFSLHEVLTLASIIEKETGDARERPLISSVFHNRLGKNMRLETDPTVIYGIKDFDGNLTKKHLKAQTPYNTYKRKGLPPGPIANPGLASIEAALYPEDSTYLYFVSRKDKTHQFSTNIRDHINSVRKYQLNK